MFRKTVEALMRSLARDNASMKIDKIKVEISLISVKKIYYVKENKDKCKESIKEAETCQNVCSSKKKTGTYDPSK